MKALDYWKVFSSIFLPLLCALMLATLLVSYPSGVVLIYTNMYGELVPEIILYAILLLLCIVGGICVLKEVKIL